MPRNTGSGQAPLEVYLVGGAVRDRLLGLQPTEHDWVVVGATPEAMRARGFRPVGRDFPVFLHPETGEEYALARQERKSAPGYRGFEVSAGPSVTLEQDLARRDLTVNAMAEAPDGRLIDPFGGQRDLAAGVLRHVSEAFVEDPVRVLRVARFMARFAPRGFKVAPETLALLRRIAGDGELDALVPERVWQELSRALREPRPSAFFDLLAQCGARAKLFPEFQALAETAPDAAARSLEATDRAAGRGLALPVVYACLCHPLPVAAVLGLSERWRVPRRCRELAALAAQYLSTCRRAARLDPTALLATLEGLDALRRPARLSGLLEVLHCVWPQQAPAAGDRLQAALDAALAVQAGPLGDRGLAGLELAEALRQARCEAIARAG